MKQRTQFHYLIIWALVIFATAGGVGQRSLAQGMSPQVVELKCSVLYELQQKYFNRHVTYDSAAAPNLENRTVEQFIKYLDGSKMYLLSKDVEKIKKSLDKLFNKLRDDNNCEAIVAANQLFNTRMKERVEFVKKTLGPKFKFNPKVKLILDPEKRNWPANMEEANAFHEKYIQYQIANYLASDMNLEEAKQRVVRNYERIMRRIEETPERELWARYMDSFARALDPHTSYLSKDALEDFEIQMRLSLEGIGATLSSQDGFTVIEQLIAGGAAFRSGKLKSKDKIIEVAQGETGEVQNVIEMDLRDVVRLIRGKKGTKVRLTILRKEAEGTQRFQVVLVRDKIKLEDEAAQITYLDREVKGAGTKKVALLTLPSFYSDNRKGGRSAASDMKKLIEEANANKADALVLDLSNNGGGSLEDAVKVAGLFFRVGNVVKQSGRAEERGELALSDRDPDVDWAGPLVVLVSRVSASASEIVSGALQDYKRAVVVGGDHTFGKGTVQSVEYLPLGLGAMKTTIGMFFTPSGNSTQHRGVTSDIEFPSAFSTDDIGEKTLDYSLPPKKISSFLSRKAYVAEGVGAWKVVTPELIGRLKKASASRIATSAEFKKVKDEIEKAKKRGHTIDVAEHYKEKTQAKKDDKGTKGASPEVPGTEPKAAPSAADAEGDGGEVLSREEQKKRYMERADVQEAVNIAIDMAGELGSTPNITIGAKPDLDGEEKDKEKN
ncbi:MAG: carboxy terminal-processing peptidase [Bdellovibrionales bacterium]|nr:carboxy terminal-processing peptidase [Bdellovibrionales bacterium]